MVQVVVIGQDDCSSCTVSGCTACDVGYHVDDGECTECSITVLQVISHDLGYKKNLALVEFLYSSDFIC